MKILNHFLQSLTQQGLISKKEISLKAKTWINKNIQALMRECDRLFKHYCNENNPTLTVAKYSKYEKARNVIIFKVKKSKKIYISESFSNIFKKCKKKPGTALNQL